MGFIDFLKKIVEKSRVEEPKGEAEKVAFNEIGNWVENKRKKIEDREKEIFVLIKNKISVVIKELAEKIRVLESVDIESKKVEDKIKLIVRENLNNYVVYVKKLTENLDNLEKENFEKFTDRINKIFSDFSKKSHMSYQKVTFLIGNEIADIRNIIINFSRYLEKVFKENKDLVDSSKTISFIESKLKQIDETDETAGRVDEGIRYLDRKIKNIKEMNKRVLGEIEKIKKSRGYIENLKKQEEIESTEKELEKEIYKLKKLIDFKALGNIFHVSKKNMDIVKAYKEDFQATFQKSNGKSILSLLDEAKLNNETISAKIKQINDKKEKIIKNIETLGKNETEDLLSKTREMELEIENLNNEKIKGLKKYDKFKTNREEITNSIKQELIKINVVISE